MREELLLELIALPPLVFDTVRMCAVEPLAAEEKTHEFGRVSSIDSLPGKRRRAL